MEPVRVFDRYGEDFAEVGSYAHGVGLVLVEQDSLDGPREVYLSFNPEQAITLATALLRAAEEVSNA